MFMSPRAMRESFMQGLIPKAGMTPNEFAVSGKAQPQHRLLALSVRAT